MYWIDHPSHTRIPLPVRGLGVGTGFCQGRVPFELSHRQQKQHQHQQHQQHTLGSKYNFLYFFCFQVYKSLNFHSLSFVVPGSAPSKSNSALYIHVLYNIHVVPIKNLRHSFLFSFYQVYTT